MSLPSRLMSKPACSRTRIFFSSRALTHTNSSTSGWSTLRMTILAARRVLPPDLMVPAEASAPRSEEHTSELQSLMRISYAVFCLKKQKHKKYPDIYDKNYIQHR